MGGMTAAPRVGRRGSAGFWPCSSTEGCVMLHRFALSSRVPRRGALVGLLAAAMLCLAWAAHAHAITGNQKLLVVLCKFPDKADEPQPPSYFETMFKAS